MHLYLKNFKFCGSKEALMEDLTSPAAQKRGARFILERTAFL
jgi:hypothetical protein